VDGAHFMQPNDLALTAGWGHGGKGGVTMPGKGRLVARDYTDAEWGGTHPHLPKGHPPPDTGGGSSGLPSGSPPRSGEGLGEGLSPLGETTYDVYLNGIAYWANVPAKVWEYTIGGYQVMKKWLSYRELPLLGRPLSLDEARAVTQMARRIAALLLLTPALDANYQSIKAATYAWNDTDS
jgi:hypothetical protein